MKKNTMKKMMAFVALFAVMFLAASPVYAASITCFDITVDEKIVKVVHTIILIFQVVGPVLLVIFGMLDLVKGVMAQKEDEIKKGQQTFIKRLIAAVIIFFVIAIVRMVVSFVTDGDENGNEVMDCIDSFLNG